MLRFLHNKTETNTYFSKTTTPQYVQLQGKLSTIIIFKLCTFNVNLALCIVLGKGT